MRCFCFSAPYLPYLHIHCFWRERLQRVEGIRFTLLGFSEFLTTFVLHAHGYNIRRECWDKQGTQKPTLETLRRWNKMSTAVHDMQHFLSSGKLSHWQRQFRLEWPWTSLHTCIYSLFLRIVCRRRNWRPVLCRCILCLCKLSPRIVNLSLRTLSLHTLSLRSWSRRTSPTSSVPKCSFFSILETAVKGKGCIIIVLLLCENNKISMESCADFFALRTIETRMQIYSS